MVPCPPVVVSAPGRIRTSDQQLRRQDRPAPTDAGRCCSNDLAAFRASRRGPTTAVLLQILLQRSGGWIRRGVGLESTAGADRRRNDGSLSPQPPASPDERGSRG